MGRRIDRYRLFMELHGPPPKLKLWRHETALLAAIIIGDMVGWFLVPTLRPAFGLTALFAGWVLVLYVRKVVKQ